MKAVIVNFTGSRPNWGCQATSHEMLRFCREVMQPFSPGELSVVPSLPPHLFDLVAARMHRNRIRSIYGSQVIEAGDLRFLERLAETRFGELAERVRQSDVVFFQGEGTMGPKQHFAGVRFFALPLLAKVLWNKPVISFNQSFYAANASDLQIADTVYRKFDIVALRETHSYALCRSIGLDGALLCPDLAFRARCSPNEKPVLAIPGRYFCVSGSAALDEYNLAAYAGLIRDAARRLRLRPVFLYSKSKDARIVSIASRLLEPGEFSVVSGTEVDSHTRLLPILRDAEFVIGGRYHTSVSALAQGTPVILLPGNTHKTEGLAPLLGLDWPVVSLRDPGAVAAEIDRTVADRAKRSQQVLRGLDRVDAMIEAFRTYLQQFLEAGRCGGRLALPASLHPAVSAETRDAIGGDLYASVNAGRGYRTLGRLRRKSKQLGIGSLVKSLLTRNNLAKLQTYLSMRHNRTVYDTTGRIYIPGPSRTLREPGDWQIGQPEYGDPR